MSLLQELFAPPDAPPLLLITAYRSDEVDRSPALKLFVTGREAIDCPMVDVGPLGDSESLEMVDRLLGSGAQKTHAAIAREAKGSPYFIEQIAGHVARQKHAGDPTLEGLTLERILGERLTVLGKAARNVLQTLSVASRPTAKTILANALGEPGLESALTELRGARLIRSAGAGALGTVHTYHDRIREAVVRRMDDALVKDCHLRLAAALETEDEPDLEALTEHLLGAGEKHRAGRTAALAAERATSQLAFETAARLYGIALDHAAMDPIERVETMALRAAALANAGQSLRAGEAYERAAELATEHAADLAAGRASALRFAAGEQFLRGGAMDRGIAIVDDLIESYGFANPQNEGEAYAEVSRIDAELAASGFSFRERPASEISRADIERVELLRSISMSLLSVDMTSRVLLSERRQAVAALELGEPLQVLYSMCLYVGTAVAVESYGLPIAQALELIEALARRFDDPRGNGWLHFCKGYVNTWRGRPARADFEEAERIWSQHCTGMAREISSARFYIIRGLAAEGLWLEARTRGTEYLRDAVRRGDLYMETDLRLTLAGLFFDGPEATQREVDAAMSRWSRQEFDLFAMNALNVRSMTDLAMGKERCAWERLEQEWPRLEPTVVLVIPALALIALTMRARVAIAMAAVSDEPLRFVQVARQTIERLEGMGAGSRAAALEAGLSAATGDIDAGRARLEALAAKRGHPIYRLLFELVSLCTRKDDAAEPRRREILEQLRGAGVSDPRAHALSVVTGFQRVIGETLEVQS